MFKGGRCKKGFLYYAAGGAGNDCLGITRNYFSNNGGSSSSADAQCKNFLAESNLAPHGDLFCDGSAGGFHSLLQVILKVVEITPKQVFLERNIIFPNV